ncbi:hypothetical protein F4604DRAFT_1735578 [Suillus subluteus]|nr:hypothetical protein F4604DRAFT_1735578 [Suillus subluteus]
MASKMQRDIWLRLRVSEVGLSYFNDSDSGPVKVFHFVIKPKSFSQSVENLFHLSYLFLDQFCKHHFVISCCSL